MDNTKKISPSAAPGHVRLYGMAGDSIVDGPGLRLAVFTQGCFHNCPGCHNPGSHDPAGGSEVSAETIKTMLLSNHLLRGVTLSGGEPLLQAAALIPVARFAKELGLDVFCYTGYTYEEIMSAGRPDWAELLDYIDVLVDGRYNEDERDIEQNHKGSRNQRMIDIKNSKPGAVVEWTDGDK